MSAKVKTIPLTPEGKPRMVKGYVQAFEDFEIPFALIEGNKPGPFFVVTAGVHGSEVCGIETARRLTRMPPEQIRGSLLVLPTLNPKGVDEHSIFVMPEDGKNLNRQFPGKVDGTVSERLAHWLVTEIYSKVGENAAYLDLHSADATEELTPFTLFIDGDAKSQALATAFRLPIAVKGGSDSAYTVNGASSVGLPGIIVEVGGGGRWNEAEVVKMSEGIARVMKYLNMLVPPSNVEGLKSEDVRRWNSTGMLVAPLGKPPKPPVVVTAKSVKAGTDGYWVPNRTRKPGDKVDAGEILGQIEGLFGNATQTVAAETSGRCLYHSVALKVAKDDVLFCISTLAAE